MPITHAKVSALPDGGDTSLVRPSDWNADHVFVGDLSPANAGVPPGTLATTPNLDPASIPTGWEFAGYGLVGSQELRVPFCSTLSKNLVALADGTVLTLSRFGFRAVLNTSTEAWTVPAGQSFLPSAMNSHSSDGGPNEIRRVFKISATEIFVIMRNGAYRVNTSTWVWTVAEGWAEANVAVGSMQRFAVLSDNKILLTNGTTTRIYDPVAFTTTTPSATFSSNGASCGLADGGAINLTSTTGTARLNAARNSVSTVGNHPFGTQNGVAMVLLPDGKVFATSASLAATFDPATDTWTNVAVPPGSVGTSNHAMAVSGGAVWCLAEGAGVYAVYKWTIASNTWSTAAYNQPIIRGSGNSIRFRKGGQYTVAVGDPGYILLYCTDDSMTNWRGVSVPTALTTGAVVGAVWIGGTKFLLGSSTTYQIFDVSNESFSAVATAPAGGLGRDPVWMGGDHVYVMSGGGNGIMQRYNITANTWTTLATGPDPSLNQTGRIDSNRLLTSIGSSSGNIAAIYDIAANRYSLWNGADDIGSAVQMFRVGDRLLVMGTDPDGYILDSNLRMDRVDLTLGAASGLGTATTPGTSMPWSILEYPLGSVTAYYLVTGSRADRMRYHMVAMYMRKKS